MLLSYLLSLSYFYFIFFFFFNDTATTEIYTLSLHDALPLWSDPPRAPLPALERAQYIDGWTSGYGIRDTERLVLEELARHPEGVTVVVHVNRYRTLRATPLALGLAFTREPRVRFEDWDLAHPSAVAALAKWAGEGPSLLVVPRADPLVPPPDMAPFAAFIAHVATTRKPDGGPCDDVYVLRPPAGSRS